MIELRKDYFMERWAIIAPDRNKRPKEFEHKTKQACIFCPGNERLTTPEIGRIGTKKHWQMRWFPNKFPFFEISGNPKIKKKGILQSTTAYGYHEIIVETPSDKKQLWDLQTKDFVKLLEIYNNRITELEKKKHAKYVLVIKNHGQQAGASLKHSHSQITSVNIIPPVLKKEIKAYANGKCGYCTVIKNEKKSVRKCFENKSMIAIAPYASRFNYELWILPKKHIKKLSDFTKQELTDLGEILKKALVKLKKLNVAYNYFLHYSPKGNNLHFHIEITPRLEPWAGIEYSSGITVNATPPEKAAKFYKKN